MVMTAAMKLKDAPWKESYDKPRQRIKKQRFYFADKGPSSQNYGFSSHVYIPVMYTFQSCMDVRAGL